MYDTDVSEDLPASIAPSETSVSYHSLHSVTVQETTIRIFIAVKTTNFASGVFMLSASL
jgi:hypothetical protein